MPYCAARRSEHAAVGQHETARVIGRTHALLCIGAVAAKLDIADRKAVNCTRPARRTSAHAARQNGGFASTR
jgi:hypothetical protein